MNTQHLTSALDLESGMKRNVTFEVINPLSTYITSDFPPEPLPYTLVAIPCPRFEGPLPSSIVSSRVTRDEMSTVSISRSIESIAIPTLMLCVIIFITGLFVASIAFLVYSFTAIINTSSEEAREICNRSDLWEYLFMAIVFTFPTCTIVVPCENIIDTIATLLLQMTISLVFSIWGLYELYGVNCVDELQDTLLYKMSYIQFLISTVEVGALVIIPVCYCAWGVAFQI